MDQELMASALAALDERFHQAFDEHQTLIARLASADLAPGERKHLDLFRRLYENGIEAALRRRRSRESRRKLQEDVEHFCAVGPTVILQVGAQRGGDFLLNQLRGQWAEKVCCSVEWPGHHIVEFGPSGAAMPGEQDHEETVRAFREIVLAEGKRPDLLAVPDAVWVGLTAEQLRAVGEWPERRLGAEEEDLVRQCRCGIEVKNSTWHYEKRRAAGGGPLAVTVKDEELEDFGNWEAHFGVPVLFMQVLFDEVYCMSFRRMKDAIRRGRLYVDGDYVAETDRTSRKYYHRFFLADDTHLCAKTVFPKDSEAIVSVLPNGSVIPYIRYRPIGASDANPAVIECELAYSNSH